MPADSSLTVEKTFSREEFTDLLIRAARHLVERCRVEYCEPPPPSNFRFIVSSSEPLLVAPSVSLMAEDVVPDLIRPDGSFRNWINLSPVAVTGDRTVLAVDYPDRFTKRMIVGPLAFPFEPLHLLGPSLPSDWVEGTPVPKVSLPSLE